MIQRIQSLFLILVSISGLGLFFTSILSFTTTENVFEMNAYHTLNIADNFVIGNNIGVGSMQGLVILLALFTVFMYKKRQIQIKLCKLNLLLVTVQIAAVVMYIDVIKRAINPSNIEDIIVGIKFGAFIPLVSLILIYLSIRFIKNDEDLIRSADRLR